MNNGEAIKTISYFIDWVGGYIDWKRAPTGKFEPYTNPFYPDDDELLKALKIAVESLRNKQAKREPLSYAEIMQIVNENEGDTIGVVRMIEKAHGIGV